MRAHCESWQKSTIISTPSHSFLEKVKEIFQKVLLSKTSVSLSTFTFSFEEVPASCLTVPYISPLQWNLTRNKSFGVWRESFWCINGESGGVLHPPSLFSRKSMTMNGTCLKRKVLFYRARSDAGTAHASPLWPPFPL